jgi:hypothetical protein
LKAYYTGLVNRNIVSRKIPQSQQVPTAASIKKIKTVTGDAQTFRGSIHMLDYMTQRPMVLNALVHVKDCTSANYNAVFVEVSPNSFNHAIWQQFNELEKSFSCEK